MKEEYGPFVLRLIIGLLFLVVGISKLMNPNGIIEMLGNLGFPAAGFFGWLVIVCEIVFGLAVLLGLWTKWTVWPLVIILLVALIVVYVPALNFADPSTTINLFWHLLGIASLISVFLTGAGALAVTKED